MDYYTVLAGFITLIVIYVSLRLLADGRGSVVGLGGSHRRDLVALVGLSQSGKTAFLSLLAFHRIVPTVPSQKENIVKVNLDNSKEIGGKAKVQLLDVPGHVRLRELVVGRYLNDQRVKAIVFFIDSTSSSFLTNVKDIAEYLYAILSQKQVRTGTTIPVLIACNKQDSLLAYKRDAIKLQLEREIQILRATKSREILALDDESEQVYLGYEDTQFKMEDLENKVSIEGCSVASNDLESIKSWILKQNP